VEDHQPYHAIIIVTPRLRPVFRINWSGEEELTLLVGMRILGFGNWHAISKFIGTKSATDCEQHYLQSYVKSPSAPLPLLELAGALPPPAPPPYKTRPARSNLYQQQGSPANPPYSDVNMWMPHRHEFQVEFCDSAEQTITPMLFTEDDTEETFNAKVAALVGYNALLAVRQRMDSEVEKWGIQERRVGDDVSMPCLHGESEAEREIDERILSLSPCLERQKLQRFADLLHKKSRLAPLVKKAAMNHRYGIKGKEEEASCAVMTAIASANRWEDADIAQWNQAVERCSRRPISHGTDSVLLPAEIEYCAHNGLENQYFLEAKAQLMREFTARGTMSPDFVQLLAGPRAREMLLVYEFLRGAGWMP
jgi:hypothetical protein